MLPNIKVTKIQDNKSVLIELENSGWKFICTDGLVGVETGLYFAIKTTILKIRIFLSQVLPKVMNN